MTSSLMEQNFFVTGILPDHNYRFVLGRNTLVARETAGKHAASRAITGLMGEAMLGAFFLSTHSIKDETQTLSLHLETEEPPGRVIVFASNDGAMRGYASQPDLSWDGPIDSHLKGGVLRVNRWNEQAVNTYSSAVELRHAPLYKNLEEFTGRSEQIQTFLHVENNLLTEPESGQISGYLFQALPGASMDDTDAVVEMLNRRGSTELMERMVAPGSGSRGELGEAGEMLHARIHRTGSFFFRCNCNRDRIKNVITSLGQEEAHSLLEEYGEVEIFCEFCRTRYSFSPIDIQELFQEKGQ